MGEKVEPEATAVELVLVCLSCSFEQLARDGVAVCPRCAGSTFLTQTRPMPTSLVGVPEPMEIRP